MCIMYGSTIFHISGQPDVPFKGQADGTGSAAGRYLRLPKFLFISKFERPKWEAPDSCCHFGILRKPDAHFGTAAEGETKWSSDKFWLKN